MHHPKGPKHMPSTTISVTNESKRVTDGDVSKMVSAVGTQLARDVAPIWGLTPTLESVPHGTPASPDAMPCTVSDTPDVPGAGGYHDEGDDGRPYIKVFTFEGAAALTGSDAVSVTFSHECGELTADAPANRWVDGPGGVDYALELCDPVEGDTYEIDGVSVSNFVYPEYFDPKAPKGTKFDYLEKLSAPFTMTPHGYLIKRTEPGKVSQVFAAHREEGHDVHDLGDGVFIVFGAEYPEHKKAAKIAKAKRRRGGAA